MKPFNLKASFIALSFLLSAAAFASGSKRPDIGEEGTDGSGTVVTYPVVIPPDNPVTDEEAQEIEEKYSHLDPDKLVPSPLLEKAVAFYDANLAIIKNQRYMVVIDFKQHSGKKRFYLIDMESGEVEPYLTAHGKNSDPDYDGYATKFSNTNGSLMSSLGFYLTAETYYGEHGYSLRLDGLSSTNSNARKRAIVIHGASYVNSFLPKMGRSYGCPALDENFSTQVIDMIKGGTLIFADG
ncbi:hypothetical protein C0V70_06530 [Bacteriovorax stolpii]|uniref:Uncharacterized protein n=1 Tax=Bacteriovorax stolpii TaxID=960 RepID=A0A2K9NQJ7_BACTC|nr:murein L,D-transpeptidase catalytic domain family protein [Bacteriovorax stolpii]AUN97772.1 hypothetical protein C0V70_06530 [Bacteriovorax stolpii]TDP51593.1 L,D-transpeptidase-like protein [Bacteriovorax stolpii]